MSNTIYSIILPVISKDKNKYNFVYQITEISTNMKYIGSHGTEKSNALKALKKYKSNSKDKQFILNQKLNPLNYWYEILSYHETRDEALFEESILHLLYDVKCHPKYYNRSNQLPNGFTTTGKVCVKDEYGNISFVNCDDHRIASRELVHITTGKVVVKDIHGNVSQVDKNNSDYLSGKLVHNTTGKVVVKDIHGNVSQVDKNNSDYLSGKLVHIATGKVVVKDMHGNVSQVDKNDPRIVSRELVGIATGKINTKDIHGNTVHVTKDDPRFLDGSLVPFAKNKVPVKDIHGNTMHVDKDDPRFLSGDVVHITTGKVSVKDIHGNYLLIDKDDPRFLNGELIGVTGRWYIILGIIYSYIQVKNKFNISLGILKRRCKSDDLQWNEWKYFEEERRSS